MLYSPGKLWTPRRVAARIACGLAILATLTQGVAIAGSGGNCGGGGVPEIDANSALSAMAILTGGILIVSDRIRKRLSSD